MNDNSLSVYVIDSIAEHAMEMLEKKHRVVRFDDPEIVNWPERAHAIITRTTPITAEKIARSKHLRLLQNTGLVWITSISRRQRPKAYR